LGAVEEANQAGVAEVLKFLLGGTHQDYYVSTLGDNRFLFRKPYFEMNYVLDNADLGSF